MIPGLMQPVPLLLSGVLRHAAVAHADREIVSRLVDEPTWRYGYGQLAERSAQAAGLLEELGIVSGDRVTSLAWNTHRHVELFFAVPGIGAVLHTANPRLSDDQLVYTINHAQSVALFYDCSFAAVIERLAPRLEHVCHYVALSDPEGCGAHATYEKLLAGKPTHFDWPTFDENAGAFLCYTSGTTGEPKGVLYSHRSVIFHALSAGLSGSFGIDAFDSVMPCQSLYHATGWGIPFITAINGSKLVLPCNRLDPISLQELIDKEGVTFSGGVPTIWSQYLDHVERSGTNVGSLRKIVIGGSAVPREMAERFHSRHGVEVLQAWGMTETSPIGVVSTPSAELAAEGDELLSEVLWTRQGRLQYGIELKIVDERGEELPHDDCCSGALMVRGPWVIERYYRSDKSALDADGWFDTGDIATIDKLGFMRITDRKKDVIKSGGEWISSIDAENSAAAYPGVKCAAVVGVPHPKWEERPILILELHDGVTLDAAEMLQFLQPKMPKWWLPDRVIFDAIPLTSVGKIDKKALRETYTAILENELA